MTGWNFRMLQQIGPKSQLRLPVNLRKAVSGSVNFPEFWAKGEEPLYGSQISCWGWSNNSVAEAQELGRTRAKKLVEILKRGKPPKQSYYGDRPFREEVLKKFNGAGTEPTAVLTRNSYGCVVLNTARAMFVDVDLPELENSPGIVGRLFGKVSPQDSVEKAIGRVEEWNAKNPTWGWRIYRTRAGLRLLATHELFDAEGIAAREVFDALGADPLYRKLCVNQKCFRARLTPKPWRIGLRPPGQTWPWRDGKVKARFKKWEEKYMAQAEKWATCQLVKVLGSSPAHPGMKEFVEVHDTISRAESGLPLA